MSALAFRHIKWILIAALAAILCLTARPVVADSDVLFTGGGFIKDGRAADAKRISFSVNVYVDADGVGSGHLGFRFHNLDEEYRLDQTRFTAMRFDSVIVATHYLDDTTPYTFVRIEATGQLDGMADWSVLARFSDFGVPVRNKALPSAHADALRIMLFDPNGDLAYDSAQDYPREQAWRALLDGGNVSVDIRLAPASR